MSRINISSCQICFPLDPYRENKDLQTFVHKHKPAPNESVIIAHIKPVTVLMDINDLISEAWRVLSLTSPCISELQDEKLTLCTVSGRRPKCRFLF